MIKTQNNFVAMVSLPIRECLAVSILPFSQLELHDAQVHFRNCPLDGSENAE